MIDSRQGHIVIFLGNQFDSQASGSTTCHRYIRSLNTQHPNKVFWNQSLSRFREEMIARLTPDQTVECSKHGEVMKFFSRQSV